MKNSIVVFLFCLAAVFARADAVATITLDNGSPTGPYSYGHSNYYYNWTYTISVTGGDLSDVQSIEIYDVLGVVDTDAPNHWDASYQSVGGGLYDVTFTNDSNCNNHCSSSLNGFVISSTDNIPGLANYTITYGDGGRYDPVVGAPAVVAAPEPASLGLTGLALLALGGLKGRWFRRH